MLSALLFLPPGQGPACPPKWLLVSVFCISLLLPVGVMMGLLLPVGVMMDLLLPVGGRMGLVLPAGWMMNLLLPDAGMMGLLLPATVCLIPHTLHTCTCVCPRLP